MYEESKIILQNGTKDSISKLVEDLNAAKYEDDVGEYYPHLLTSCVTRYLFSRMLRSRDIPVNSPL